ncbi:oxidoreductase [Brevibacillus migulae]|uniref:oxidoreductase n=1 Tax=Brevibacillus migulae TaxID=1644114 RepID=UPI00106EE24B|nr:oxidoreductase [Brevibacillus migulae]
MKRTALVAGATGLIGGHLVKQLLDNPAYEKIIAISRRPLGLQHEKLDHRLIDFNQLEQADELFQVDSVFCCLGTTIKKAQSQEAFRVVDYEYPLSLGRMAKNHGVSNFLLVSSMGANAQSSIFYSRVKGELEEQLIQLDLPSLHIFRPSLLLGDRQEFRFGEKAGELLAKPLSALLIGKWRKYRPIEAGRVARAMVIADQLENHERVKLYESDQIAEMTK